MKRLVATALLSAFALTPVAAEDVPAAPVPKPEVQTRESQAALTPALALERLQAGNARFASNAMKPRDWSAKVAATAAGQFPFAAVLACMDSRAPSRSFSIRASEISSRFGSPARS